MYVRTHARMDIIIITKQNKCTFYKNQGQSIKGQHVYYNFFCLNVIVKNNFLKIK
jgi:hypothetical protein